MLSFATVCFGLATFGDGEDSGGDFDKDDDANDDDDDEYGMGDVSGDWPLTLVAVLLLNECCVLGKGIRCRTI